MADAHANFAATTVATAPSPATSGTSLVVAAGDGAKFPAVPFNATICPAGTQPTTANAEIVRVTAVATDTLTITRTQESTSARTVVVGDQIFAGITAKTLTDVEGVVFSGYYGDGSDGNVTISSTVTLTRDMFYDTLTIQSGGILNTAGFRVHCKTMCNVNAGGIAQRLGTNAASATAAAALAAGSLGGSVAGAAGTTGVGANAANTTYAWGGPGGNGGAGVSAGGFGGSSPNLFAADGPPRALPAAATGFMTEATAATKAILGGGGGGGGGGDATNAGGGGGSGGGVLIINARAVINSGTIAATGGNGFSPATGNCGGGGGGGGGVVIINTSSFTGSNPTAAGGTGGTKVGTGVNGSNGSTGQALVNVWV